MKKSLQTLGIFCLIAGYISCDYMSAPYPRATPNNNGDCQDAIFTKNPNPHRIVLLEDFTGHKCMNCPQGAEVAKTLKEQFKDSLIVVAIHASMNNSMVDKNYPENFETDAGNEYMKFFNIKSWPSGMVNRIDFPKNAQKKSIFAWGPEISKQLKNSVDADLQIISQYNAADSSTCISVQTIFQSASVPDGEYYIILYLTQDHIIAPQANGTIKVDNYEHNHALRDNITSTWGDLLIKGPVVLAPIVKKYKYKVRSMYKNITCIPQNCHLVAFIYDKNSYRIIQAAETKLIK